MIVDAGFLTEWKNTGHRYGECMSTADGDLMYVYIPKNASSWTKPNLQDWGWEFYNYHTDALNKHAIVALRDPVDRWLSGIAECMFLYHPTFGFHDRETVDLVFDRVVFDDHTEKQVKFLHGLDTDNCTFLLCDQNYSKNFADLIAKYYGANRYATYEPQHVSERSPERKRFKEIFQHYLLESKYLTQIQNYFEEDYKLINSVQFYGTR